eukprot:gnl/TRDRNA2_/TRDRNA2_174447_c0_seq5.p2 gnl/TRDRNA2_/TRDRNA2_174447_c0~~gnl/TRDRNA2_/TRDRNA2_174447_c0_seq5.p2  ORF type:complete len:202 (-),score=17.11 gnl/TRDRNA2_/TRDRNA2_174447_c0_seq5:24-629(-)
MDSHETWAICLIIIHGFVVAAARTPCLWSESVSTTNSNETDDFASYSSHRGTCFITLAAGDDVEDQTFVVDRDNVMYCCEYDGDHCCTGGQNCCDSCCTMDMSNGCGDLVCNSSESCQKECVQDFATSSQDDGGFIFAGGICGHRFKCCPGVLGEKSEPAIEVCEGGPSGIFIIIVLALLVCCLSACAGAYCFKRYKASRQ